MSIGYATKQTDLEEYRNEAFLISDAQKTLYEANIYLPINCILEMV
jgi:hypothetical protein